MGIKELYKSFTLCPTTQMSPEKNTNKWKEIIKQKIEKVQEKETKKEQDSAAMVLKFKEAILSVIKTKKDRDTYLMIKDAMLEVLISSAKGLDTLMALKDAMGEIDDIISQIEIEIEKNISQTKTSRKEILVQKVKSVQKNM